MHGLDLINTSVLGALGCDMSVFLRYFPAARTMYEIFVAIAIGLTLLIWIWNLFKNFGLGAGSEAEDPIKLSIRSILFIFLAYYSDQIIGMALDIGGTPYDWILTSELPELNFASFSSILFTILGSILAGAVALIALIPLLILAWNYIKLLSGMCCWELWCLPLRWHLPWVRLRPHPISLKAGAGRLWGSFSCC